MRLINCAYCIYTQKNYECVCVDVCHIIIISSSSIPIRCVVDSVVTLDLLLHLDNEEAVTVQTNMECHAPT